MWDETFDKALTLLAQRKNKDLSSWYNEQQDDTYAFISTILKCNLCGYIVNNYHPQQSYGDLVRSIRYHGMGHLKEHNLLPFI